MLEKKQLANIGFDFVTGAIEPWSPYGDELRRRAKPYSFDSCCALRREFRNMQKLCTAYSADPASFGPAARALMQLKDVRRSLERTRGAVLSDIELFELKRFFILAESLEKACREIPSVRELEGIELFSVQEALSLLDPDGTRTMTFRLSDGSSEELCRIRRDRKETDIALRNAAPDEKDALEARRLQLAAMEENEEQRLRAIISKALSVHAERAEKLIDNIARFDFALAKARLMAEKGASVPVITDENDDGHILFENMVNPMLSAALEEKGRRFTPVSIELSPGSTVITGANMGGKSVAVKTLALNVLSALSGLPVFAEKAELPMLEDIHLLAEDAEDSRGGLSSFGGEMVRFDGIVRSAVRQRRSLVLLDEFARGTNPKEGSALVRAAVRFFGERKNIYALITTHFDDVARIANVHYQVIGLKNADENALLDALKAAGNSANDAGAVLSRFMDYGLFRADKEANPPRDALRISRALGISPDFMECVKE